MAATAAARRIHRAASERGISVRARRDKAQRGGFGGYWNSEAGTSKENFIGDQASERDC